LFHGYGAKRREYERTSPFSAILPAPGPAPICRQNRTQKSFNELNGNHADELNEALKHWFSPQSECVQAKLPGLHMHGARAHGRIPAKRNAATYCVV
jgi:hypothetical protein